MRGDLWLPVAALNGALAVAAGAFGAHALEGRVPEPDVSAFHIGAQYHMYHALALLAVSWFSRQGSGPSKVLSVAGWAYLGGIVLFSGSLYIMGMTGSRAVVWLTPIGGLSFIAGWLAFAWAGYKELARGR